MKTTYSLFAVLFIASSFSLNAMMFRSLSAPLNDLQMRLVLRTIQKRGLDAVRHEIKKTTPPQIIKGDHGDIQHYAIALEIEDIFHKHEIPTNTLARDIFSAIAKNEKIDGYIPNIIETERFGAPFTKMPNNSLDDTIRYYWVETDGTLSTDTVRIEAHFINKTTLLELVNNYKN